MEPLGLTLMALGGLGAAAFAAHRDRLRAQRRSEDLLRQQLHVADQRVQSEFHRARRAMNDAAGQSWRNLAG